jgi:hypothetical protein
MKAGFLKHPLPLLIAASLVTACGGGGGGGDDSDSSNDNRNSPGRSAENIVVSPVPDLSAQDAPAINLSGVASVITYEGTVSPDSIVSSQRVRRFNDDDIQKSGSNVVGLNENGELVLPFQNVVDLKVNWQVLSPDLSKVYISVSPVVGEFGFIEDSDLAIDSAIRQQTPFLPSFNGMPLIGPKHTGEFVNLSESNYFSGSDNPIYTSGFPYIGDVIEKNDCPNPDLVQPLYNFFLDGEEDSNLSPTSFRCLESDVVTILKSDADLNKFDEFGPVFAPEDIIASYNIREYLAATKELAENEDYFYCNVLIYDRLIAELDDGTNPVSCFGGLYESDLGILPFGYDNFLVDMPFKYGKVSVTTSAFDNIRAGLTPLQFDSAGNIYFHTSEFPYFLQEDERPSTSDNNFFRFPTNVYKVSGEETPIITPMKSFDADQKSVGPDYISLDGSILTNITTFTENPDGFTDSETRVNILTLDESETRSFIVLPESYSFGGPFNSASFGGLVVQNDSYTTVRSQRTLLKVINDKNFAQVLLPNYDLGITSDEEQNIFRSAPVPTALTREGSLLGCIEEYNYEKDEATQYTISLLPFKSFKDFNIPTCDTETLATGFNATIEEVSSSTSSSYDTISIFSIDANATKVALEPGDNGDLYEVTSVAIADKKVVFAGSRINPAGSVSGTIDLEKFFSDDENAITITDERSNSAASNKIIGASDVPPVDSLTSGKPPVVEPDTIDYSEDRNQHIGITFTEPMNEQSVLDNLQLKDNQGGDVPFIPFWAYQSLYLIVDTDGFDDKNGDERIDDDDRTPFESGRTYTLTIKGLTGEGEEQVAGATDKTGLPMEADFVQDFTFN